MRTKFDPKIYRGKDRVYTAIIGSPGISRLWHWSARLQRYDVPTDAKPYVATKYVLKPHRERLKRFFNSLDEARAWQRGDEAVAIPSGSKAAVAGPLFSEYVGIWKARHYRKIGALTTEHYEKMLRLHFNELSDLPLESIAPKTIDAWIEGLHRQASLRAGGRPRLTFRHELNLLTTILRDYIEHNDESSYVLPLKKRHREAIVFDLAAERKARAVEKDLTEDEFGRFAYELAKGRHGKTFVALATCQYYQALRISEAAAIYWSDIVFDTEPARSRLLIRRSVQFRRQKGTESRIVAGFKNSRTLNAQGVKEQPMIFETYQALRSALATVSSATDLVFHLDGQIIEYRQIQHAYDSAFRRAGLIYRATHIMRHGGSRRLYNATGDLEVAKQLLGNRDLKTVQIYAQRSAKALTDVVREDWLRTVAEEKTFQNIQ